MVPIVSTETASLFGGETISCDSNSDGGSFKHTVEEFSKQSPLEGVTDPIPEDFASHSELCKSSDPFLYYSNDSLRNKALTLRLEGVSEKATITSETRRKTRISFELYPSMFLGEMMDELCHGRCLF
mmetsp:Transcript_26230/g.44734  ORF Transcript_26230/g.44734 Transcript_26230/m.44734 type:complete len:127 (-) Transcript_26230:112-492(-)